METTNFNSDTSPQTMFEVKGELLGPTPYKWYNDSNLRKIVGVACFTTLFMFAEFAIGIGFGSLALLADAFHMLSDLLGLVIGGLAITMSKKSSSATFSYGWLRAETIGALINGVFLLSVVLFIFLEAIQRFFEPPSIDKPVLILIIGAAGLVVNIIGLLILSIGGGHSHGHSHSHGHGHSHKEKSNIETLSDHHDSKPKKKQNLNIHGVILHVLGDALGSVGVCLSGLGIWLLPWEKSYYLDPIISVIIAFIILSTSIPLVKRCVTILMQSVPRDISLEAIKKQLLALDGIQSIHELHIWQLDDTKIIATVHLTCSELVNFDSLAKQVKKLLHTHGIHSVTIQPEFIDDVNCTYSCTTLGLGENCSDSVCCKPSSNVSTALSKQRKKVSELQQREEL